MQRAGSCKGDSRLCGGCHGIGSSFQVPPIFKPASVAVCGFALQNRSQPISTQSRPAYMAIVLIAALFTVIQAAAMLEHILCILRLVIQACFRVYRSSCRIQPMRASQIHLSSTDSGSGRRYCLESACSLCSSCTGAGRGHSSLPRDGIGFASFFVLCSCDRLLRTHCRIGFN